ncbi:hypothetical protein COCNU_scaffold000161G000020 [Cocos nucifera]|nr:hypothetical protein [Cocos nucifera]
MMAGTQRVVGAKNTQSLTMVVEPKQGRGNRGEMEEVQGRQQKIKKQNESVRGPRAYLTNRSLSLTILTRRLWSGFEVYLLLIDLFFFKKLLIDCPSNNLLYTRSRLICM